MSQVGQRQDELRGVQRVIHRLEQWPALVHVAISLVLLALVAFADYAAPKELSLSIFYFVPVVWAIWFTGRWTSLGIAVFTAMVWGVGDMFSGAVASDPTVAVWNEIMRGILFVFAWATLSAVKQMSVAREEQALTDALTGVANIRVFAREVEREIHALRRTGRPFTLAYLDLDKFKAVNDSLGHQTGDHVLRRVARYLQDSTRDLDTVARLGGDEFAILMRETDAEGAGVALERTSHGLREIVHQAAPTIPGVGATVGATVFLQPPWSVDHALSLADAVMYEAKRTGGGRVALRTFAGD